MNSLSDLHGLRRVRSAITDFPKPLLDSLTVDSDRVKMEDAFCEHHWKYVSWLLTERIGSSFSHTMLYPMCLGGLNGTHEQQVATLSKLKRDSEGLVALRACKLACASKAARRHTLNTPAMSQTARIARRSNYKPSAELATRGQHLFEGIGNEDILEDTLGKVRDAQNRDGTSKVLQLFKSFEVPHMKKQIEHFGRDEIVVTSEAYVDHPQDLEGLFAMRKSDALPLEHVTRDGAQQNFDSFTPETLRSLAVEQEAINTIHERFEDRFNLLSDAWVAKVVPLHHFVLARGAGGKRNIFYTIGVHDQGLVTWPCHRVGGLSYIRLGGVGSTEGIEFITSLDNLDIVPFTVVSPLHAVLDGAPLDTLGCVAMHGKPEPLMTYQAKRGFAGVPEGVLQQLCDHKKLKIADRSEGEELAEDFRLAMALTEAVQPELTEAQMLQALHQRMIEDTFVADAILQDIVTEDMICEVVSSVEKDKVQKKVAAHKSASEFRTELMPRIQRAVSKLYVTKPKKLRLPGGTYTLEAHAAMLRTKHGIERWWNRVVGDMTFVEQHKPPIGAIRKDDANGRFLVRYPNCPRKSISWTQRTMDVAALETLRHAWRCHTLHTGLPCPHPVVIDEPTV